MATRGIELTNDWMEVTGATALNMVDGENYVVEVQGPEGSKVRAHDEAMNTKPAATADGQLYFPGTPARQADYRIYPKKAVQYWWMKAEGRPINSDPIKVVITEALDPN